LSFPKRLRPKSITGAVPLGFQITSRDLIAAKGGHLSVKRQESLGEALLFRAGGGEVRRRIVRPGRTINSVKNIGSGNGGGTRRHVYRQKGTPLISLVK
jgi:hypothetical protein